MDDDALLRDVTSAIDVAKLRAALEKRFAAPVKATPATPAASSPQPSNDLLGKLVLADILDDAILGARPGEKGFPLRTLLHRLAEALETDAGFTFACAANFYFRATTDEETKMRLGVETSRAFYRFARDAALEPPQIAQVAPLVATLLNGELSRVRLESLDHLTVFDSQVHERELGSDGASAQIVATRAFLCRVAANNMVRVKALVRT
jgi:hypothetical protein